MSFMNWDPFFISLFAVIFISLFAVIERERLISARALFCLLYYQKRSAFLLLSKIFCNLGSKLGLPREKINILISQFSSSKALRYYKQSIVLLLIGIINYYYEISLTITEIFVIFLIIIIVVLIICKFRPAGGSL